MAETRPQRLSPRAAKPSSSYAGRAVSSRSVGYRLLGVMSKPMFSYLSIAYGLDPELPHHGARARPAGVLDETPGAYKDIDAVMAAQADLIRPIRTLKQVVCVKGSGNSGFSSPRTSFVPLHRRRRDGVGRRRA